MTNSQTRLANAAFYLVKIEMSKHRNVLPKAMTSSPEPCTKHKLVSLMDSEGRNRRMTYRDSHRNNRQDDIKQKASNWMNSAQSRRIWR